ncbi:VCBS domain-containing protein [Bradyrhizobium sp. AUGA SZCCT0240]|uniref:VCBS domain-containing protein n=1 Tax=Bradyrhizobium sp. AUGA SZCCT0240 TaxID=2807669 RepID=UPI001BA5AD4C|nr:VCBS domain-containing protein [Bradyrhizobium sp. AUGA SZCCT0240]MBR1256903.1 VCBS domain-containing protein [Bradyrhizobium sp. AUGA SZCCT0240]
MAGKFTDVLPDGHGAHLGGHLQVDSVSTHAPSGAIIVPDAHLLFTGDFKRAGVDLVLSGDGREMVLHDYFKGEKRAALASPDGAHLTGDIVNALTGHLQLAQADGSPSVAQVIGHVTKLVGTATAIRNGVSIILNNGDNVNKGDVVQSGSDSTLGITFIDGSVFGLASNARMVLNEMIYDPNGSNNSSLISLVQGTISFVAGATAKKGDMKVDTPVATMGIRGTAVLVEIDFAVPGQGGAPPAKFQVLVEPDGTTGSYILFDKTTMTPIATVNQAGTQTIVSGQGTVNFLSSVQLSPDAQKIISDVFQLKFTDLNNPQTLQRLGSAPISETMYIRLAGGETVPVTLTVTPIIDTPIRTTTNTTVRSTDHIPGPPDVVTSNAAFTERAGLTGSAAQDTLTGEIAYSDLNPGDVPTAQASFASFKYENAQHSDVTASLTAEQVAAIKAVEVPLIVVQDPNQKNRGTATWTYSVPDGAFDFLAAGETLTLTYLARVDNNFAANNEITFKTFTITITGTNDAPTVVTRGGTVIERDGTGNTTIDTISGTVSFTDTDLTDRPVVSAALSTSEPFRYLDAQGHNVTATLTQAQLDAIAAVKIPLKVVQGGGNGHNGSATWTYSIADHAFDFLAKGETLILNYVIKVDDGHGGVVYTPVSISINGADVTVIGTNDVPTIATTDDAFAELSNPDQPNPTGSPTPDTASGTITFTDVDLTDRPVVSAAYTSYSYVGAAQNQLSLTAQQLADVAVALDVSQAAGNTHNGSANWTYTVADGKFDFLAVGEILTLTYTAKVDDGRGGVITKPFTITITGTNDTAAITTTNAAFTEMAGTGNAALDHAGGTINFTDADLSDRPVVSAQFSNYGYKAADGTTNLTLTPQQVSDLAAALSLTPAGGNTNAGSVNWSYDVADNKFDFLADGEVLTLTYVATVNDGHGGVITKPITVTVTGTNDAPTVTAVNAGTLTDTAINDSFGNLTGTLVGYDADHDETASLSYSALDLTSHPVNSAIAGQYGSLTVNADGTWSYVVNATVINALHAGAYTDTFTVQTSDVHGAIGTAVLTVHVNGANDTPTLAGVAAGKLTDGADNDSFGDLRGILVGNDRDSGETATLQYAALDAGNPVNSAVVGLYGSLTVNPDGTYTYVPNAAVINALHAGSYTDTFTVQTIDVNGAIATAVLTVDVTGDNDTPTLGAVTAGKFTDGAANDSFSNLVGLLNGHDRDSGETATLEYAALDGGNPVNSALAGLYGSLTVNPDGTYTYVPNASVINALHAGSYTDTFTVQTSDVNGASGTAVLTVDVTGANDAPTLAAVNAGTLTDTAGNTNFGNLTGTLVGADLDSGETVSLHYAALDASSNAVTTVVGDYGSLTVNADGTYRYVANAAAINALHTGSYVDTFTVQTSDANGATGTAVLTVDVIGANDAPTLAAVNAGTLTDTAANDSFGNLTGALVGADLDSGETASLHYAALDAANSVVATVVGDYGSLTVNADGTYSYVANAAAINALHAGTYADTFTVQTSDVNGATGTAVLTVNVTGANDAPTMAAVNAGTLADTAANDSFADLTGTLVGADFDSGETASLHYAALDAANNVVTTVVGNYGSLTVNANGTYSYVANAAAINALNPGSYADLFTVQVADASGALGTTTLTVDVTGANEAPVLRDSIPTSLVIETDQFHLGVDGNGVTTVTGLYVTDSAPSAATETITLTTATGASPASGSTPSTDTGSLAHINATLDDGVTYDPGSSQAQTASLVFTVADSLGGSDTVNFIFNQGGAGPDISLTGTSGKDVIFATENTDTLTGGAGADQFVFRTSDGLDTITDFTPGQDHIDLRAFLAIDSSNIDDWLSSHAATSPANSADVLITVDDDKSILLKHVALGSLHAGDFIVSPHA